MSQKIRLLLPCPPRTRKRAWGDWYFGQSLGAALARLGADVRFSYVQSKAYRRGYDAWNRKRHADEVALVLRGKRDAPEPLPEQRAVMWLISQSQSITPKELARFEHVFVASEPFHAEIKDQCQSSSVLHQCTDITRFTPKSHPTEKGPILFVGNRRDYAPRPIVQSVLDANLPLEVWGKGWKDHLPAEVYAGLHIENDSLASHYGRARVVLNDHTEDMVKDGFVSNRVYDVLASGGRIFTEDMPGIPEDLREYLWLYEDYSPAGAELVSLLNSEKHVAPSETAARHVQAHHSFDDRARMILDVITKAT